MINPLEPKRWDADGTGTVLAQHISFPVSYTHLTYYLWAKDNVPRVSADADAAGGEGTPDPGPEEIVIDTIDRSRPVMDDILHSAADNAPAGMFGYPHFNEVDLSLIHI